MSRCRYCIARQRARLDRLERYGERGVKQRRPILYLTGRHPSPSETFIRREVEALRARGLVIDVLPLGTVRSVSKMCSFTAWTCLQEYAADVPWRVLLSVAMKVAALSGMRPRPSHIHAAFMGIPAIVAAATARRFEVSYSLSGHARDAYVEPTPPSVVSGAAFRTACTQTVQQYLEEKYVGSLFKLVRHGINVEAFVPRVPRKRGETCRIVAAGRFVPKKGFAILIEACAQLKMQGIPATCHIAGTGPEGERLKAACRRHGVEHCVTFLGWKDDIGLKKLLESSDVLVVPSVEARDGDRDGVPNIVIEAMAAGLPVVASRVGAIPEAVRDGETGWLVTAGDANALAGAIGEVWRDESRARRIADAARAAVERDFSERPWIEMLAGCFEKHAP